MPTAALRGRAPAPVARVVRRPRRATCPPAVVCAAPAAARSRRRTPKPGAAAPTAAPPSQALLDAFAILRRPRTDQDALSPQALQALRVRGLAPVAPDSARLLRSTPSGGKAWVVPVPDVTARLRLRSRPARSAPREGLAVVATGDAASGGGGALDDLVRGRSPVTVAPCAGADHSMLSISGIVPNGVPAAFLTAPDGTAVRADVKDNGYEFLLPNAAHGRAALRRVDRGRRDAPRPARGRLGPGAARALQSARRSCRLDGARLARRPVRLRDVTADRRRRRHRCRAADIARTAPSPEVGALRYVTRCWAAGRWRRSSSSPAVASRPRPPVSRRPAPPAVAVAPVPAPAPAAPPVRKHR